MAERSQWHSLASAVAVTAAAAVAAWSRWPPRACRPAALSFLLVRYGGFDIFFIFIMLSRTSIFGVRVALVMGGRRAMSAASSSSTSTSGTTTPDPTFKTPTIAEARAQARRFRELPNDVLFSLAVSGDYNARKERFIREIMRVDNIDWVSAKIKIETTINAKNDQFAWLVTLPYRVGLTAGVVGAVSAVPLVFHRPTAAWFNENFVHEALPDDGLESLDTVWKVGNWTWGWMEPYLGTASFVLLGLQFARIHMQRLHLQPYTERVLSWRARRLAKTFPQYESRIVMDFSKADPWH